MPKVKVPKKYHVNIVQLVYSLFIFLLFLGNAIGVWYSYTIFKQITEEQQTNVQPDRTKLIQSFNNSLYNQIKKDRSIRPLYQSSSPVPHYNVAEIFGS